MIFDILLFILAASIALYLAMFQKAPWLLITVYWAINAVKILIKMQEGKDD